MSDGDYGKAIAYLEAAAEANGVGSVKFDDGEMFMFSRKTVEELKRQMDEKGSDRALVFVKTGPIYRDT